MEKNTGYLTKKATRLRKHEPFSAVQKKNTTSEIKDMYEFNPEQILPAYSQEL